MYYKQMMFLKTLRILLIHPTYLFTFNRSFQPRITFNDDNSRSSLVYSARSAATPIKEVLLQSFIRLFGPDSVSGFDAVFKPNERKRVLISCKLRVFLKVKTTLKDFVSAEETPGTQLRRNVFLSSYLPQFL